MNDKMKKRLKSLAWRTGAMTGLAVFTYLSNIGGIKEIDLDKLLTLGLTTFSALVVGEITKYLNSQS